MNRGDHHSDDQQYGATDEPRKAGVDHRTRRGGTFWRAGSPSMERIRCDAQKDERRCVNRERHRSEDGFALGACVKSDAERSERDHARDDEPQQTNPRRHRYTRSPASVFHAQRRPDALLVFVQGASGT